MDIEVGMMVEIISDTVKKRDFVCMDDGALLGHVGRVLRRCDTYRDSWDIEGAETSPSGHRQSYGSASLRPIPDQQALSSWETVQAETGWHPQKAEA